MIAVCACYKTETAWIPRRPGLRVLRTEPGDKATIGLQERIGDPKAVELLVSSGFCGGLDSTLQPGDIVLGSAVQTDEEAIAVGQSISARIARILSSAEVGFRRGPVRTAPRVVSDGAEKHSLAETGAIAVDMESGYLARWARRFEIDFVVVRAVLDPLRIRIPFNTGRPSARSIAAHPLATMRLAKLSVVAGKAVGRAIAALAEGIGEEAA